MSGAYLDIPAASIQSVFDGVGYWWANATAHDFGLLAVAIVIGVWFLTKYYLD